MYSVTGESNLHKHTHTHTNKHIKSFKIVFTFPILNVQWTNRLSQDRIWFRQNISLPIQLELSFRFEDVHLWSEMFFFKQQKNLIKIKFGYDDHSYNTKKMKLFFLPQMST